jgi:galactonate dehydratase
MKITDIRSYPVWVGQRNQMVVKVETDEGIYGLGEAGLSGRELAVLGAVRHYREFLLGRDPMRAGALWQEMYRSQYFEGGRTLTAAISAIDMALYDIKGKALGVPVYQLLGGRHRDVVPCFATPTAPMGEELIELTQEYIRRGWNVIRIGAPTPDSGEDGLLFEPRESIGYTAKWVGRIREAIGSEPVLGVEYHHRLNVAEAASFCQRLPSGTLDFLEEPIRDESPEAYETLRKLTNVPFAIGEEFSSKWAFLPYIEKGLTNFARLDISNIGGFTEAMKVAGWAEAHYIDLMPHNPLGPICSAASIHLAAAVPNFFTMEVWTSPDGIHRHTNEDLFPLQPALDGACYPVPTTPGLGVDFNEELAKQMSFQFWEAPHLHRRDGSYTNW